MRMTEKEFKEFAKSHPDLVADKKKSSKNKFKNTVVYVYGDMPSYVRLPDKRYDLVFDSLKEYQRYCELKMLEKSGDITQLERQKKITIQPAFKYKDEKIREIAYRADFFYCDSNGRFIVEDVKAYDKKKQKYLTTKDFNLKWKLLKYKYPEYDFRII